MSSIPLSLFKYKEPKKKKEKKSHFLACHVTTRNIDHTPMSSGSLTRLNAGERLQIEWVGLWWSVYTRMSRVWATKRNVTPWTSSGHLEGAWMSLLLASAWLLSCISACDLGVFLFYVAKLTSQCYTLERDLADELQAYIIGYYVIFQKNLKVNVSGTKFNICLAKNVFPILLYSISQLTMPASAHLFKNYIILEASSYLFFLALP